MIFWIIAILWLLVGAKGYVMVRESHRRYYGTWTQMDRFLGLLLVVACGPIVFLIGLDLSGALKKEAKW